MRHGCNVEDQFLLRIIRHPFNKPPDRQTERKVGFSVCLTGGANV